MVCPTYDTRHRPSAKVSRKFPQFDAYYTGNEYFIRPVRCGQEIPSAPGDVTSGGSSYLVQDLDGEWVALANDKSLDELFIEMEDQAVIPMLMN